MILSGKGTIATFAIVPENAPGIDSPEIWMAGQSVLILRLRREGPVDAVTLYSDLSSPNVAEHLKSLSGGATIPALSTKDLQILQVMIPSGPERNEIGCIFAENRETFRQIEALRTRIEDIDSAM